MYLCHSSCCRKKGLESIDKLRRETGLEIKEIIYHTRMEKAFTDLSGIFSNEKDRTYAKNHKKYETNVAERPIDIMGFKRSEGLIGFYYNTPNNTLAIFGTLKRNLHGYRYCPEKILKMNC